MKNVAIKFLITALLITFSLSAKPQALMVTNSLIGTVDWSSYDTAGDASTPGYAGILLGYFKASINAMYPQWRHMLVSKSRGGANMETVVTNSNPAAGPAVWCFATSNNVVPIDLYGVNDNGSYSSNEVIQFGTNYYAAPGTLYNGTGKTNEGFNFALNFFFSGPILSGGKLTDTANVSRNVGAAILMANLGKAQIDIMHDVNTNGFSTAANYGTSVDGTEFFFVFGHPTQKNAYQHFVSLWRNLGLNTNVGNITIDYATLTVPSSNAIAAVNLAKSGNTLTFTFKSDRQPPIQDITPGRSNNVSTTLWTNCPAFGNVFQWVYSFTNLNPSIAYNFYIDGVLVDTATGAQWLAGRNLATNQVVNNPFNTQGRQILADVRQEYGVDFNGLSTHSAGSPGPLGRDLINYLSDVSVWPTKHGPSLVNDATIQGDINSMWGYAGQTHTDSQQTNHVGMLAPSGTANAATLTIGTVHIGG